MPGLVRPSLPDGTFPVTLSSKFTESHSAQIRRNEYHDGTIQGSPLVDETRRTWKLTKRLTASELATLRTFWETHRTSAFSFYNPFETTPQFAKTPTGSDGLYLVRFAGDWSETIAAVRSEASVELVELGAMNGTTIAILGYGPHGAVVSSQLFILTSHILGVPSAADAMCSIDGFSLFSRGWMNDYGAWTLRTDSHSVLPSAISTLNVLFASGTASPVDLTTNDQFLIYDCWLVVTYSDAATETLRPTSATINTTWTEGTISNPGFAIDNSTATAAVISRDHLDTLNFSQVLVLGSFSL